MKLEFKGTPGPWRWEVNLRHKDIQLCGGVPRYDLTVMDFVRYGMDGAQPRFNIAEKPGMNLMHKSNTLTEVVEGREHHADWFQTIKHPDAQLIAAAPDLLDAALKLYTKWNANYLSATDFAILLKAIHKALGISNE